jgi:Ser/Thr protein kinase RdoA (MazF antagonist)
MPSEDPEQLACVLADLGAPAADVVVLKDLPLGNGSWLLHRSGSEPVVLRRYYAGATRQDIAYEHAVLGFLTAAGWVVPYPIGELVERQSLLYCLTRYVPGQAVTSETAEQRRRRGRDLARLQLALRGRDEHMGQRPGWRAQHLGVTVHTGIDWETGVQALSRVSPRLAAWAAAAAHDVRAELAALGADELPVTMVHGDFHEGNVHYDGDGLAGVIDFGLTHVDSRPYELAVARTHRAPEMIGAYRQELADHHWPLSDLEESVLGAINRAFRVDMVAWDLRDAQRTGRYDLTMIERQLQRART